MQSQLSALLKETNILMQPGFGLSISVSKDRHLTNKTKMLPLNLCVYCNHDQLKIIALLTSIFITERAP